MVRSGVGLCAQFLRRDKTIRFGGLSSNRNYERWSDWGLGLGLLVHEERLSAAVVLLEDRVEEDLCPGKPQPSRDFEADHRLRFVAFSFEIFIGGFNATSRHEGPQNGKSSI